MSLIKALCCKNKRVSFLFLLFCFLIGTNLQSQTVGPVIFQAEADAELSAFSKNLSLGKKNYIGTSPSNWYTSVNIRRSLIRFDLSSIPAGAIITQAKLILRSKGGNKNRKIALHRVNSSWKEKKVTWQSFLNTNSFVLTPSASHNMKTTKDKGVWNVKNDVQKIVDGDFVNNGWLLKDNAETTHYDFLWRFHSRESNKIGNRPKLRVSWIMPQDLELNTSSTSLCRGESSTLTATGGIDYTWSPSTGLNTTTGSKVVASPSVTTEYTVTTTVGGLVKSKSVLITVNEPPALSITSVKKASNGLCDGAIKSSVTGGSISWTSSLGYSSNKEEITGLCPDDYTLTVTSGNGCSVKKVVSIGECTAIDVSVEKKNICFGSSNGEIALTGGASISNPSCPGKLYDNLCNDYSYKEIGSEVGDYTVKDEIVLIRGSYDYNITVDGGVLVVCGSVKIKGLTLINGGSAQIFGAMDIMKSSSPTLVPEGCSIVCIRGTLSIYNDLELDGSIFTLADGTTMVHGQVAYGQTQGGQTNNATGGSFYNGGTTLINGVVSPVNFDPSSCSDDDQDNDGYDFSSCNISWDGPGGYSSTAEKITGLIAGTYTATINCDGCEVIETVNIKESPSELALSLNVETTLFGKCDGSVILSASGGSPSYTYELTDPNGQKEVINSSSSEEIIGLCAGDYTVKVTDAHGCVVTEVFELKGCYPLDVRVDKKGTCFGLSTGEIALLGGGNNDSSGGTTDGSTDGTTDGGTDGSTDGT